MTVPIQFLPFALAAVVGFAHSANEPEFALTLRDHKFTPAEIRVPANTKVKLIVDNQDATPKEFDSHALNREKVIASKSKAQMFVGRLAPGGYRFMGELHEETAQGAVV